MPEFLLTKEEWEAIVVALPVEATCGQGREAIAQAALRKVAAYVKRHSLVLPVGTTEPVSVNLIERHVLYLGAEEWGVLMTEAGLTKEVPDAKA